MTYSTVCTIVVIDLHWLALGPLTFVQFPWIPGYLGNTYRCILDFDAMGEMRHLVPPVIVPVWIKEPGNPDGYHAMEIHECFEACGWTNSIRENTVAGQNDNVVVWFCVAQHTCPSFSPWVLCNTYGEGQSLAFPGTVCPVHTTFILHIYSGDIEIL